MRLRRSSLHGFRAAAGRRSAQRRRSATWLSIVCTAALLAACGGGGGGGGSSAGGSPVRTVSAPDPIRITPVLQPGEQPVGTAESTANYGVAQIGADIAYAAGATGRGVKVAVIDSGISLDHPEFAGRLDRRNSIDIVTGGRASLEDESGHGSHVAGIIAANVDGAGMRGIAPQATLLAIRADLRDASICDRPGCGYFDSDVAAALDYARAQGADVINLSIGKDGEISSAYRTALERAVASGALVVVAAGNQGNDQPLTPARLATQGGIAGGMLVAGAVDRDGTIYGPTNRPGGTAPYFLVAPGVDIYSTFRDGRYARLTGTSMATPHIAGAAALLKGAFPSLSMQQVAAILLETADDLGAPGIDQRFGSGLVNLERALQPVGTQQVALDDTVDGRRVALADSRLTLGSAFGDASRGETRLADAMVLDAYDRPYTADFRRLIERPSGVIDLEQKLLDQLHYRELPIGSFGALGIDARLGLSEPLDRPIEGSARAALDGGEDAGQRFERLSLDGIDLPYGTLRLGLGLQASDVDNFAGAAATEGLFLDVGRLLAPADDLLERGTGASLGLPFGDAGELRIGLFDSADLGTETNNGSGSPGRLATLGLTYRLDDATTLQLGYNYVDEASGLLGSRASGAFAFADGAVTHLGTLRLGYRPLHRLELFAQATLGLSRIAEDDGLLRNWDDVRSDAFALGLVTSDVAIVGDRVGVVFGQPLRVGEASAVLDLPTARTLDGGIERQRQRIDLTPSGRERRLELAYQRPLDETSLLGTWLLLQHQPGHDAEADPAVGIGLRYTNRF